MVASWLLNFLLLILGIRLQPNDLVAPNFLFFLVWLFPLFFFAKYFVSRPTGKRASLVLLLIGFILLLFTNLLMVGPTFAQASDCTAQYSGFKIRYQCNCRRETVEWRKTYDCRYSGFRFIPIVREDGNIFK